MEEFWEHWGALAYVAAAMWAFFEGETFVLVAAAAGATSGVVDPWILLGSVWLGSFAGDQTWFTLGKRWGSKVLLRFPRANRHAERAKELLDRYGPLFILSFRFLYGIRNVAAAVCGIAGMPRRRFALLNFIAAGVWASSFVAAGWFLGNLLGPTNLLWLLGGLAITIVGILLLRQVWRRRRGGQPSAGE